MWINGLFLEAVMFSAFLVALLLYAGIAVDAALRGVTPTAITPLILSAGAFLFYEWSRKRNVKLFQKRTPVQLYDDDAPAELPVSEIIGELPRGECVYIIRDVSVTNFCKIGRTNDMNRRLSDFGVKLPFQLRLVYFIMTPHSHRLERQLHALFHDKRVNGEWFQLEPEDILRVRQIDAALKGNQ